MSYFLLLTVCNVKCCILLGFWNSYDEVAKDILAVVKQQVKEYPNYSLYSTGYVIRVL